MYILANWFTKLIRIFFYSIDKIVYNFITAIYDLLISIARTSILTQGDINQMADRIYKLLAVFMIFKVTLSLITYVVNPDDFSDKTKGVSKLSTNIVISLALLILTPYIFNYAYKLQTIILEDNSLATLVFGSETHESFLNTAGQDMAYITMSPFFTPNVSIVELYDCTQLVEKDLNGNVIFNEECSGIDNSDFEDLGDENSLRGLVNDNFTETELKNYVSGVEAGSLGLMFRQDMATAMTEQGDEYIMDYKWGFSTVVGVVIVLLLISFCMDVALRSVKLAFLQLIAPIPIISYVDPKSGKDGLFKKWYQMCFKTFISLFVRLLALYFAVYIISKVADMKMVDIIDGSYVSNGLIAIFIIVGALMFAKQLPKILEGLGIKIDGDGKFTLNPLKKFEESTVGGKRLTGAVGGMIAGVPRGNLLSGALRGAVSNKGFRGGFSRQADVNRKIGEARMNGAGFFASRLAGVTSSFGMENADLEGRVRNLNKDKHRIELAKRTLDAKTQEKENKKKRLQDSIAPDQYIAKKKKNVSSSGKALVDFSKSEITGGKAGIISTKSKYLSNIYEYLKDNQNKIAENDISYYAKGSDGRVELKKIKKGELISPNHATDAQEAIGFYENKQGAIEHLEVRLKGKEGFKPKIVTDSNGVKDFDRDVDGNIKYEKMSDAEYEKYQSEHTDFDARYETYSETAIANGEQAKDTAKAIKAQSDSLSSEAESIEAKHAQENADIAKLDKEISEIRDKETIEFEGKQITIAEAERIINEREKQINDIRTARKTNVEAYKNRRIGGGH